jgi:hypothetical protein
MARDIGVWQPFRDATSESMQRIASRIAYLLTSAPDAPFAGILKRLDQRIVLPLLLGSDLDALQAALAKTEPNLSAAAVAEWKPALSGSSLLAVIIARTRSRAQLRRSGLYDTVSGPHGIDQMLCSDVLQSVAIDEVSNQLLGGLTAVDLVDALGMLFGSQPRPNRLDWLQLPKVLPSLDRSSTAAQGGGETVQTNWSAEYVLGMFGTALLSLAALFYLPTLLGSGRDLQFWHYASALASATIVIWGWSVILLDRKRQWIRDPLDFVNFGVRGLYYVSRRFLFNSAISWPQHVKLLFLYVFAVWGLAILSGSFQFFYANFGTMGIAVGFAPLFLLVSYSLVILRWATEGTATNNAPASPLIDLWLRFFE